MSKWIVWILFLFAPAILQAGDYYQFRGYVVDTKRYSPPVGNYECKLTTLNPYNFQRYFAFVVVTNRDGTENRSRTKWCHLQKWTEADFATFRKWKKDGSAPLKKGDIHWLRVVDDD